MIIWHNQGSQLGRVAKAGEALKSGMVVRVDYSTGEPVAWKVTNSTDLANYQCGVAYQDLTTKTRKTFANATTTSKEYEDIAIGENLVVISGEGIWIDTNQVEDGNYIPGALITINFTTARFELKQASDTQYGRVDTGGTGTLAASQNRMIRLFVTVGKAA